MPSLLVCILFMSKSGVLQVTGAGAGGIATAARLAKAGWKITVIEKNDFAGGRCSLITKDGYVRVLRSSNAFYS